MAQLKCPHIESGRHSAAGPIIPFASPRRRHPSGIVFAASPTTRSDVAHHPPLPCVAYQCDEAVDAVDELAVGHGQEQREDDAEMQRQQRPTSLRSKIDPPKPSEPFPGMSPT